MTRSRAKRVKDAMRLLIQATIDDMVILAKKRASSMLGLMAETGWSNFIQAEEEGAKIDYYATA